tara:strand:+ start:1178 stop:2059 length:882 start_codon:yes stop_codon:yes gene_type:complete
MSNHPSILILSKITFSTFIFLLGTANSWAQDNENKLGWSDTAELTAVFTEGNSAARTIGFKNELIYKWNNSTFTTDIGSLRAESTEVIRSAVGDSPKNFQIVKNSVTSLTAKSDYARARYDQAMSPRTFWYTSSGWERNTFAGIQNRYSIGAGLGNTFFETNRTGLRTSYGVSYTIQDDVIENPEGQNRFAGIRLSYDYDLTFNSNTTFTSVLLADENLSDVSDFRIDFVNSIAVNLVSQLALKFSWQLLYDFQPSLIAIPLVNFKNIPSGSIVNIDLDRMDNLITFALVANF